MEDVEGVTVEAYAEDMLVQLFVQQTFSEAFVVERVLPKNPHRHTLLK